MHRNGNIAGNGNSGSVSPRNPGDTTGRKRLSDQTIDACGKKRRVNDVEEQVSSVTIKHTTKRKTFYSKFVNVGLNIKYNNRDLIFFVGGELVVSSTILRRR